MSLAALTTAAILVLAPELGERRAAEWARPIVAAAESIETTLGSDADEAIYLVVAAHRESSWRAEVADCRVTGDRGRALTAWQLHPGWWARAGRDRVCRDRTLAAKLALRALDAGVRSRGRPWLGYGVSEAEAARRRALVERVRTEVIGGQS